MSYLRVRKTNLYRTLTFITLFFILGTVIISFAISNHRIKSVSADAPFVEVFRGTGLFYVTANGVGTRGNPETGFWSGEGSFDLDIPDSATITMARLIWTGRSDAFDPNGVQLSVDGGAATTLTADFQFEQTPWCCNGADQRHESALVTNLVQPGLHTYTVSGHEHGLDPNTDNLNYGVGIWVVYEYDNPLWSNDPIRETVVYQGQDSFFRLWDPPRGPHTEVRCADFAPSAIKREAEIVHLVSGIDTWDSTAVPPAPYRRSVTFWHETGNGPPPPPDEVNGVDPNFPALSLRPNVVGVTGDTPGTYPIQSYAGLEWDTYELDPRLTVDANQTWTCFQIESGDSVDLAGIGGADRNASGMWNLFAISVFDPSTAVDLLSFDGTTVSPNSVKIEWETAAETNNFGFNLYRGTNDDFGSAELIHFEPSTSGNNGGARYSHLDTLSNIGTYTYWLEDIDTDSGVKTLHGPIQVQVSLFSREYLPLIFSLP